MSTRQTISLLRPDTPNPHQNPTTTPKGFAELVTLLLAAGTDCLLATQEKETAHKLSRAAGHRAISEQLRVAQLSSVAAQKKAADGAGSPRSSLVKVSSSSSSSSSASSSASSSVALAGGRSGGPNDEEEERQRQRQWQLEEEGEGEVAAFQGENPMNAGRGQRGSLDGALPSTLPNKPLLQAPGSTRGSSGSAGLLPTPPAAAAASAAASAARELAPRPTAPAALSVDAPPERPPRMHAPPSIEVALASDDRRGATAAHSVALSVDDEADDPFNASAASSARARPGSFPAAPAAGSKKSSSSSSSSSNVSRRVSAAATSFYSMIGMGSDHIPSPPTPPAAADVSTAAAPATSADASASASVSASSAPGAGLSGAVGIQAQRRPPATRHVPFHPPPSDPAAAPHHVAPFTLSILTNMAAQSFSDSDADTDTRSDRAGAASPPAPPAPAPPAPAAGVGKAMPGR